MGENIKNSINYIGKGLLISLTFTLIALIIFSKSSQAPKAAGETYDAGKR